MKELYGLLGEKLGHSFSPKIHFSIFEKLNLEGYYHLFEVKNKKLKEAVDGFKALNVKGVNVTIPYKVKIIKYLDETSREAKAIGAVNTLCFKQDKIIGYNTDYYGFGMMLEKFNVDVKNKNVVILGTGGAAKAVVQYILDNGARNIIFVSRDINKVTKQFNKFKIIQYDQIKYLSEQDIVINCTPVGMYPQVENSPMDKEMISKFKTAVDLIYNPQETLFLKQARDQGLKAINGLYMLVGQAVKAQELWNDLKIDAKIVDKIYQGVEKGK
ncbi:shikimate dehydrogenase [Clostridium aestuarii]|uniref:Shikimate dehydrogenase (NADP(+)) n=1 Tax=Clostridium aestuarii TaxID=338193 RepID=A0ABT4D187_9CLOT|nr:shikimate dehydrogenase [Clostridium aestuarii]MCY6485010.1 shikimate dehydrogenase [Clostridium aestuarii]